VKIDHDVNYSKSQPLRANTGTRSSLTTLIKSKKEMKWQESTLCKLKLKKWQDTTWIANKVSMLNIS
jgi:hypothetical protein